MTVVVPPVDDADAFHDAEKLRQVAAELADVRLAEMLRVLAESLRGGAVLAGSDEWVSPAQAGQLLGVSRQYIDKMIAAGRLQATTKPGSSHRRVAVADLLRLEQERRESTAEAASIVDDLLDAGLPY